MKEDLILLTYDRYEVEVKEDVHMYILRLTIHNVQMSDAGAYKLIVSNQYGELNASVSLIVNRESKPHYYIYYTRYISWSNRIRCHGILHHVIYNYVLIITFYDLRNFFKCVILYLSDYFLYYIHKFILSEICQGTQKFFLIYNCHL